MCGSVRYRDAEPLSLRIVTPLPPNCIAKPLQSLHAGMTNNILSKGYELKQQQTVDAKQLRELFDCPS
jgi:hypothetical protein